ncbi:MAG: cytochrome C [Planctomycetota bacterium]
MKPYPVVVLIGLCITQPAGAGAQPQSREAEGSGCLPCHEGIEPIRETDSLMMRQILSMGRGMGDPAGCVVCHGGDPAATLKEQAHGGAAFYPDPGSPWINANTCGQCHPDHVSAQWNSLMMTEAGKIQGVAWSFGSLEGYEHKWGNYDARNPDDPHARLGTEAYRAYKERLKALEPGVFPDEQTAVPEAPTDLANLAEHPEQAAFTYIRNQCQRCHLAVQGRQERGDYRGMGCSACHIPYSNEGFYEGGDKSIPKDQPGHPLVHTIQATREAKVTVHGKTYSGIPVETCTTCHDRGKRIGVSFQGLMESAYTSPYTEGGGGQLALHTKHYLAMQEDVHYQRGMICQDCHTSFDVHGDGFLACANLAQVEIECADCHGTPQAYPWELPLGYMDEFGSPPKSGPPRGTAQSLVRPLEQGTEYPAEEGHLITARGNPLPEVVRRADRVIVHTAGGKDLVLKPLRLLRLEEALATEPFVAMCAVELHMDTMECYACHATWAPQCYGCHVKIDYSEGKRSFDWVAAGHKRREAGHAADPGEKGYDTLIPGKVTEQRSYLRWEDPPLAVNGEGRVTPAAPGCQVSVTVVGQDGGDIVRNKIFRTLPGSEGAGPEGQIGIDMSPTQPHTNGPARPCESCHLSEKALGYGINGGRLNRAWDKPTVVDLMTPDREILPDSARTQIEPVEGLEADWSRFVTEDGRQLQTVGHHFSGSRPLDNKQRANMDRQELCLSCHQEIPTQSPAVSLLHHIAAHADALPKSHEEHADLVHKIMLFSAWGQAGGIVAAPLAVIICVWRLRVRAKRRKHAAAAPEEEETESLSGGPGDNNT